LTEREAALSGLAIAVGFGLALIGIADVGLLWASPQFGSAEWEFGTISGTLEALTLPTVGFALLAAGLLARRTRAAAYMVAGLCLLITLFAIACAGLFVLSVPVAWKGTPPALKPAIKITLVKNTLLAMTYIPLFAFLTWTAFRNARRGRR
jgi:hypothetical protein